MGREPDFDGARCFETVRWCGGGFENAVESMNVPQGETVDPAKSGAVPTGLGSVSRSHTPHLRAGLMNAAPEGARLR